MRSLVQRASPHATLGAVFQERALHATQYRRCTSHEFVQKAQCSQAVFECCVAPVEHQWSIGERELMAVSELRFPEHPLLIRDHPDTFRYGSAGSRSRFLGGGVPR